MAVENLIDNTKGISLLIGALTGSIITGLVSLFISNRNIKEQRNILEKNHNHQMKFLEKQFNNEQELKLKEKIQKVFKLLLDISFNYSITSSFIHVTSNNEQKIDKFNEKYGKDIDTLNEIEMIIKLYFPKFNENIENVRENMNLFWGYNQEYMKNKSQDSLDKVYLASNKTYKNIKNIQYELKNEFNKLV